MNELIKEMEEYAQTYNIPIIQKEGITFIQNYMKENPVVSILEIGTAIGYSAIQMARMNASIKVVSVERDEVRYKEAIKNVKLANMEDRIELHLEDALEYEDDRLYDLIFIDAAKAQYIKFFERYGKNLNKNGAIITDNLSFHGMVFHKEIIKNRNTRQLVGKIERYIHYLEDNKEYNTTFYKIGDGIAVSKHKE